MILSTIRIHKELQIRVRIGVSVVPHMTFTIRTEYAVSHFVNTQQNVTQLQSLLQKRKQVENYYLEAHCQTSFQLQNLTL